MVSPSPSIAAHVRSAYTGEPSKTVRAFLTAADLLHEESPQPELYTDFKSGEYLPPNLHARYGNPLDDGISVWGWWRKPWEQHRLLLESLQLAATDREPEVLLYNQYLRRLYGATLVGLYFEPGLTTVLPPRPWYSRCPAYYRDRAHLTGAFLLLRISPSELDATLLDKLYVDSSSFELEEDSLTNIIPAPEGIEANCLSMIDSPPRRSSVKACEHTMLVLRTKSQQQRTAELFKTVAHDGTAELQGELARSILETKWRDLLDVLREAGPSEWAALATNTQALAALGQRTHSEKAHITRFDFELVARSLCSKSLREVLVSPGSANDFTPIALALKSWVTATDERFGRMEAAKVFDATWSMATKRYGLAKLPEGYLANLPHIEAITSAVKHDIARKFYRDHLSHNVRAALLTADLMEQNRTSEPDGLNLGIVGLLAGLFHDISMPITTFPEIAGRIADELVLTGEKTLASSGLPGARAILGSEMLKRSTSYVALIASISDILKSLGKSAVKPWEDMPLALANVDREILMETLLCGSNEQHALLSAAILFDQAVLGIGGGNYDTGLRDLMSRMSGQDAKLEGLEFASILQCIALHDRRPASEHHGVREVPNNSPKALSWDMFKLPLITSVADEMQEWGRTIGALDDIVAIDAGISCNQNGIKADLVLTESESVFKDLAFSVLEYVFGKVRSIGKLRIAKGSDKILPLTISLEGLGALRLEYISATGRLSFLEPYEYIKPPVQGAREKQRDISAEGRVLLGIRASNSTRKFQDLVLIDGDESSLASLRQLTQGRPSLKGMKIGPTSGEILLQTGTTLVLEPLAYWFGRLESVGTDHQHDTLDLSGKTALLLARLSKSEASPPLVASEFDAHLHPFPHFLDFDWRFSARSAKALVDFARGSVPPSGGRICYLGCPSLALWHEHAHPNETNWHLLDKGHYALDQWLKKDLRAETFQYFDAFEKTPVDLSQHFDVVITDPPWYLPEYPAFCQRVTELVKQGGIVGVTHYPKSLDAKKHRLFQTSVFDTLFAKYHPFGSIEVDYEIPEFERRGGEFKQFQHPALGIYRPSFLDCYVAASSPSTLASSQAPREEDHLSVRRPLKDGHHLKLRPLAELRFPLKVRTEYSNDLHRPRTFTKNLIGWTTKNLRVLISLSEKATEAKDLAALIAEVEAAHAR